MKDIFRVRRMWRPRSELKPRYDVVIVGGGSHGLATAYYLAKNHGITNVAVLEQSYIGSGAAGRNTTIIRSNYRTPEGAAFYKRSVELYEQLSGELDFNLMFSQHGHLTLAHTDSSLRVMQERAEVNQILGIDSRVVYPAEIARIWFTSARSCITRSELSVWASVRWPCWENMRLKSSSLESPS